MFLFNEIKTARKRNSSASSVKQSVITRRVSTSIEILIEVEVEVEDRLSYRGRGRIEDNLILSSLSYFIRSYWIA